MAVVVVESTAETGAAAAAALCSVAQMEVVVVVGHPSQNCMGYMTKTDAVAAQMVGNVAVVDGAAVVPSYLGIPYCRCCCYP